MIKMIFFSFFKPAIAWMGKISYLKKTVLVLLFLIVPLGYTGGMLYKDFEAKSLKIQTSLNDLKRSYALYKMLFLVHDFHNSSLAYLRNNDSLFLKSKMKKSEDRLLGEYENILVYLDEQAKAHCEHLAEKIDLALLNQDQEKLARYAREYRNYFYKQILRLGWDYPSSDVLPLDTIRYLLSVELPLNTLLSMDIHSSDNHNELLMKIGKFEGSVEKTDLLLHDLIMYQNRFEVLSTQYKKTINEYSLYLINSDHRRSAQMQEQILSLQLSMFNSLQTLLNNYLKEEYKELQRHYYIFIIGVLLAVFTGLYLFISTYLGLILSLKEFFDASFKVSKGKLGSRVAVQGGDEIAHLSCEFNAVIENLDYHYALLSEYQKALDASAIVIKTDINGLITYVNEAYEKISAYSKEELLGSSLRLIQSKNTSREQIEELWRYIKNRQVYKTVFENVAKNGKSFFVESTIVPILDRSGEISEFISIMFDITPLYRQKEKLQSKLYIDELTSIPNRLKLIEDIGVTEDAKLVVINIDGFKEINTIYGESIGDLALQKMTQEIKNALNTRHLQLYKLSADEFAILAGKEITIDHFREDVAMLSHYLGHIRLECGEHLISVRLSLGAVISELHLSLRPLISMADMALKEAKRKMRPYVFYNDIASVDEDLEKNYKMIQLIEQAIRDDKVRCCYQGIVNAKTGKIEKYETLMRLEDDKGEKLSPDSFVDLAKRTRFYPQLTQKIVQEAVFNFLHRDDSVSINLSIDDIMDDSTYAFILDILQNCGCAQRVIFEFLESEEIEFNERIFTFTAQVKKMGAQIAIDDFGSGYSNYAYLMKLGVDIIKIDASLIKDVDKNQNSRLITQSIIDIAHALGMKTIAEHVHTKEVKEVVMSMGVDYLQGYYLHKPVSVIEPAS